MFRLKICGVRRREDVAMVAAAGADAIGLNFHPASIRYLDNPLAAELSQQAAELGLFRVGVFVDHSWSEIAELASLAELDCCQLHGRQTFADAARLRELGYRVLQVMRLPPESLRAESIEQAVAPWRSAGISVLLDADVGAAGGGMGQRLDWSVIGAWAAGNPVPGDDWGWALAGGLTEETVAQAIRDSRATAIDVASGVEQPRGVKSGSRIERFVTAARVAWGDQSTRGG